ncbi:hypothetical protein [Paraliomyxa miuraensis]|uniref:hypothetical protein n=1 Tax=Paraliomyxa miuraensis TaxID=376150 RepID=UPI00225A8058|nr:hypothetical protein [Paraliomyxa miuraensis]
MLDVDSAAVVSGSGDAVSAAVLVPSSRRPLDVDAGPLVPVVARGSRPGASVHADAAIMSTAAIRERMSNGSNV